MDPLRGRVENIVLDVVENWLLLIVISQRTKVRGGSICWVGCCEQVSLVILVNGSSGDVRGCDWGLERTIKHG